MTISFSNTNTPNAIHDERDTISSSSNDRSCSPKTPSIKHQHDSINTAATASTTPSLSTSSLLHHYQQDDILTTDLLAAIRSWNLSRPTSSSSPTSLQSSEADMMMTMGGGITATQSIDSTITSVTTTTRSVTSTGVASTAAGGMTMMTNNKTPVKTPCRGNYSSRPSGLTARILEGQDSIMMLERGQHDVVKGEDERRRAEVVPSGRNVCWEETMMETPPGETMETKTTEGIETKSLRGQPARKDPSITTSSSSRDESTTNFQALELLQQTAQTLGLSPHEDTALVLPTVQKLVKILTTHVPRLENFCTKVCDLVEEHGDDTTRGTTRTYTLKERKQSVRTKKRKGMQARKERMDATWKILQSTYSPQEVTQSSPSSLRKQSSSSRALQSMDPNTTNTTTSTTSMEMTSILPQQMLKRKEVVSALELKSSLEQTLQRRCSRSTSTTKRPRGGLSKNQQDDDQPESRTPQTKNHSKANWTNQYVLDIVNQLVAFEERFYANLQMEQNKVVEFEEVKDELQSNTTTSRITTRTRRGDQQYVLRRDGETAMETSQHII